MHRSLPKSQDVRRLLRHRAELELSDEAIQRLKWFLYCAEHYYNVSLTCRHFGISRSTFLRWAHRFDPSNALTLEEKSRKPHTTRVAETDLRVIEIIANIRKESPELGKEPITEMLIRDHGIIISSSTVGRIISRHGLFFGDNASHIAKRKRALEKMESNEVKTKERLQTHAPESEDDTANDSGFYPLPHPTS